MNPYLAFGMICLLKNIANPSIKLISPKPKVKFVILQIYGGVKSLTVCIWCTLPSIDKK